MAYYSAGGELVTQGDEELWVVSSSLGVFGESAKTLFEDNIKAGYIKRICEVLSGRAAMLYFCTPTDSPDGGNELIPTRIPKEAVPYLYPPSIDHIFFMEAGLPIHVTYEHNFSGLEASFILSALRFSSNHPILSEHDERRMVHAEVMLEQLDRAEA